MNAVIHNEFQELIQGYELLQNEVELDQLMSVPFITIPFKAVSPNPLTKNFVRMRTTNDKSKLAFIRYDVNLQMDQALVKLLDDPKGERNWYFEGPHGIGKSFSLLYFVLGLRKRLFDKYRVIYVNNPAVWENSEWRYILKEVIYAFIGDRENFSLHSATEIKRTLEEWFELLWQTSSENREEKLNEFLEAAADYCKANNLKLIGILDEENEIAPKHKQEKYKFPFTLYKKMTGTHFLITCASEENWIDLRRTQGWKSLEDSIPVSVENFALSEEIIEKSLKLSLGVSDLDSKLKHLFQLSGSNVSEIFEVGQYFVRNASKWTFEELVQNYYDARWNELYDLHQKFIKINLPTNELKTKLAKALLYMDTDFELPSEFNKNIDKMLMYIQNRKLISLFPIARNVLLSSLMNYPDIVEDMVRTYLRFTVPGRGHPIEFYILHTMKQLQKKAQFLTLELRDIQNGEITPFVFALRQVKDLINIPKEAPSVTTLYIPISNKYPAIDCLIYDANEKFLYPIQITLNQINHKDSYQDWRRNYQEQWEKAFNCKSRFVWLAEKVKKKTTKLNDFYFVSEFDRLSKWNQDCFKIFLSMKQELAAKAENYSDGSGTIGSEDDKE